MSRDETQRRNLEWLVKLRWGSIVAQLAVFLSGDRLMHVSLPVAAIAAVVGVQVASNLACSRWARRSEAIGEWALVGPLALDALVLTALLYLGGGDSHPFAILYLVNVALAGTLVRPRWTWGLAGWSLALCTLVFFVAPVGDASERDPAEWQLREAWIAFGVALALLAYFLQRTTAMLREREQAVERARRALESRQKLTALATLAAGAAHELGTPLGTIAVVAKELERQLSEADSPAAAQDARLIRDEVERCRRILSQMGRDAGILHGEAPSPIALSEVLRRTLESLDGAKPVELSVDPAATPIQLMLPGRVLEQVLQAVLKNALQASQGRAVSLKAGLLPEGLRVDIQDQGAGMSPEVLARAGEPFFTTKGPGEGMGLGLFLARATLEQLGGSLTLESVPSQGTTARLLLPRERLVV